MTELTCETCGYEWEYGGRLLKATCPSCGHKVEVGDDNE